MPISGIVIRDSTTGVPVQSSIPLGPLPEDAALSLTCEALGGWPQPTLSWLRGSEILATSPQNVILNIPQLSRLLPSSSSTASPPTHRRNTPNDKLQRTRLTCLASSPNTSHVTQPASKSITLLISRKQFPFTCTVYSHRPNFCSPRTIYTFYSTQ